MSMAPASNGQAAIIRTEDELNPGCGTGFLMDDGFKAATGKEYVD